MAATSTETANLWTRATGTSCVTGAPTPGITFTYDPWAADVEACCYVLEASVVDRVINNNTVYGAHHVTSVHSITIA